MKPYAATCWELLPPGANPEVPGAGKDDPEPDVAWKERFATLDELAERLTYLAWKTNVGGQPPGEPDEAQKQRDKDLDPAGGGAAAPLGEPDEAQKQRDKDLRCVFPVKAGTPFRSWSPDEKPDEEKFTQCLRVRGPAEVEPRPWYEAPGLVDRVLDKTPPDGELREAITQRCMPKAKTEAETEAKNEPSPVSSSDGAEVDTTAQPIWVEKTVLESFIGGLLTRPLVLLAGVSGSGKTQMAKRIGKAWAAGWLKGKPTVALAIAALKDTHHLLAERDDGYDIYDPENPGAASKRPDWTRRYGFTAVQSDWTDASHLWGYHVPLPREAEGFYGTEALRVFLDAHNEWDPKKGDVHHFLLLDEMNLSRPEHYASDLLSAMELQSGKDGRPAEQVIELHRAGVKVPLRGEGGRHQGVEVPARIGWPKGLVVVGTVNIDETTFSFAPKVLDRAALLEFVKVDLGRGVPKDLGDAWKKYGDTLKALNRLLEPHNLHLAYRARNEILDTIRVRGGVSLVVDDKLVDEAIHNKVLPRIRGPRASVLPLLVELMNFCANGGSGSWTESAVETKLKAATVDAEYTGYRYPRSAWKIHQMLRRATTIGFTSFFG
ncbi:hypothetical protein L6R53_25775 [Myxococcota bacterium]|nr:hypothetical protein [Myxococcota bacterium]